MEMIESIFIIYILFIFKKVVGFFLLRIYIS